MSNGIVALALVLALAALVLSLAGLMGEAPAAYEQQDRIEQLEEKVARLERVRAQDGPRERTPALLGLTAERSPAPSSGASTAEQGSLTADEGRDPVTSPEDGEITPEAAARLESLVDVAVERKAAQLRAMREKKPSLDLFASTLELTDKQRLAAAEAIVRSQEEIRGILRTPSEEGTVFMDELVEVFAQGMANPGKDPERGKRMFMRLMAEKVPGTDQTYAEQAEAVKQRLRASFKRDWSPAQVERLEAWEMDPTEVKGIEGSPWKEVEQQVFDRARQLGAQIPASK